MVRLFAALALVFSTSCTVEVHNCVNGRDGVEVAAAYAADHWPDVTADAEFLIVSCKDQHTIETSISSCGLSSVQRPESCAMYKADAGRPARIDVSHDEDAAISTCHELQHLRDAVWFSPDGCQSHESSCAYDAVEVGLCEDAVRTFRDANVGG